MEKMGKKVGTVYEELKLSVSKLSKDLKRAEAELKRQLEKLEQMEKEALTNKANE